MPCTTLLVGKKASNDGSTMIARNDDSSSGVFNAKKLVWVPKEKMPKHYRSVLSGVEVDLPKDPLSFSMFPNVDPKDGIWPAAGFNEEGVSMTATETITTNERVLGADPYVEKIPAKGNRKAVPGGIGEEELVYLVLPFIHSAREGVLRLGSLLEKYGTYESNGIAFSDKDEIWWLESIGGHHWIAARVPDDEYVVMPNQFGLDVFDFRDALKEGKNFLCSKDLKDFVAKNHLDLGMGDYFNPRLAFGSHSDSDHVYNTPRAWYMLRYFNRNTFRWDGPDAYMGPKDDDLPWSLVPERKITLEDVKYILSSHYQGTDYDPYDSHADPIKKGSFRPIGINRTSFLSVMVINGKKPKPLQAVEWFSFGSNVYNVLVPYYPVEGEVPAYFSKTPGQADSHSFYWANRLIAALADTHAHTTSADIERYQEKMMAFGRQVLLETEEAYKKKPDLKLLLQANDRVAKEAEKETTALLDRVLYKASLDMKNAFSMSDK